MYTLINRSIKPSLSFSVTHLVWAGEATTNIACLEGEAIQEVLACDEACLQQDLGHQVENITSQETTSQVNLSIIITVLGHLERRREERFVLKVKLII